MTSDPDLNRTIRSTRASRPSSADDISTQETLQVAGTRISADLPRESGILLPPARQPASIARWIITSVAVVVAAAASCWFLPFLFGRIELARARAKQQVEEEMQRQSLAANTFSLHELSRQFQQISDRVQPCVVHIDVTRSENDPVDELELKRLFGELAPKQVPAQGSGLIVDPAGYVLTNYHVVVGAQSIQLTLHDGRKLPATLVGQDPLTDLAVLKVQGNQLAAAAWGDSDRLSTGALVWAIGSPFGLQQTITFGILSKKRREGLGSSQYQEFLQTDAAVNPGNSGGPLVDAEGKVVGINTAILGESYRGVGFAIPSKIAREVYSRLRNEGQIARGWLGVELEDVSRDDYLNLGLREPRGARVLSAVSEPGQTSPALQAGIRPGDVIIRWNGHEVDTAIMLSRLVAQTAIGATVDVVVVRNAVELQFQVRVGQRPMQ